MDSSRSSLPNVDRANSTLFKRYLEEQHKSVVKSNDYQHIPLPINSTIQITHTHRQHQGTYISKPNDSNNHTVTASRKYSNGRKSSVDISRQRSSHTSRFMKRFQRQHKSRDTVTNVQKRDARPRFEFHDISSTTKQTRNDQKTNCTCVTLSDVNGPNDHRLHHSSPIKRMSVPRLSLNERFHSSSQHRRQPTIIPSSSPSKPLQASVPMLPPITDKPIEPKSVPNLLHPIEQNLSSSPSIEPVTPINTETDTLFLLDSPTANLPNEYWPMINDYLEELSVEMSDNIDDDILVEIEESLAQRIYDCIIEQDDEFEYDTKSYSTTTNDSSALSAPPSQQPKSNNFVSHESNNIPASPICTTARKKYFQPICEQPPTPFNDLLDRHQHSTPFNPVSNQIQNDIRSPFVQSLFEPVNLLRTVTTSDNDDFNFFPSSLSFENHQNLNTDFKVFQQQENQSKNELSTKSQQHHSLPFLNHLLPPRPTPIDSNISSAFKPIEPANTRSTTSFALKRPQAINSSIGTNWFGQS
ncbi:unnamed protein product [Rotaria socialis]|uniref:Uncharacterized protein n=3 Tax=Rotaria socialis TaxID=392032 RepID=A0A817SRU0_9BILA|nr:unnamed protein product [Rotaria socialis]